MRNEIDALFSKEMTRKEFLQHVGAAVLVVFGIGGLMNALQGKSRHSAAPSSYGSSAYGGTKH